MNDGNIMECRTKSNHFRQQIDEIRRKNKLVASNFLFSVENSSIGDNFNEKGDSFISWKDLKGTKIGERHLVNDQVEFEKSFEDENKMVFLTYMIEGGSFGTHHHDCYEVCEVVKGCLIETARNYKVYNEGDEVFYGKGEIHKPYAPKDSIYKVTFFKRII